MKKSFTFGTLCFVIAVLFSACNSNFSITKRHYNNGYYVENGKDKHVVAVSKEKQGGEQTTKSANVDEDQQLNIVSIQDADQRSVTDDKVSIQGSEKTSNNSRSPKMENEMKMKDSSPVFYPLTQIKSTFSKFKKNGRLHDDGEGLSLFWIVILIILILWALGVISAGFAIGSIINLLLLAALILLILWLLRII